MKYEKEILASFKKLGFVPRAGQVECCNKILIEFVDNKKTDVCLVAPTGSGKSIIGVVVPEALKTINEYQEPLTTVIGMHQNSLVEQYGATFVGRDDVIQIKGANNYPCNVLNSTAEHCVSSTVHSIPNGHVLKDKHCRNCAFDKLRKLRNKTEHLITNYSFIFIDRMSAGILDARLCYVWDEAHLLNDAFTNHNAINVSLKRLKEFVVDVTNTSAGAKVIVELIKLIAQLENNAVTEKNYTTFITTLCSAYEIAKMYFAQQTESCISNGDFHLYKKYSSLARKYDDLYSKISDFFKYNYKHVFDANTENKEFVIKAIFIGDMFNVLRNSKYNLFMSATLTEDYIKTTMALDAKTTAFIKLDSMFPKENKEVLFVKPLLNLNYQSMQSKTTVDAITLAINSIVSHHAERSESGIIFVPSFNVCEFVATSLRKHVRNVKVFEHKRGERATDIVKSFKQHNNNGVLISPSIFEGIDLPDDISRFQILTKVPWPSLGDKRVKYISDNYPNVYRAITLHKLVQCLGRSVRSETDHATSYVLDQHGYNLLTSKENIWFDESVFDFIEL